MNAAKETMLNLFTPFSLVTERTSGRKEELEWNDHVNA
jgi:hypothetical protein